MKQARPKNLFPRRRRGLLLAGICATLALVAPGAFAAPAAESDELLRSLPDSFKFAAEQYDRLLVSVKNDPKIPRTFEGGKVKTVAPKDWTSGFVPGSLWYLYEFTRDPKWRAAAMDYTERLDSIKNYRGSHDVGFMLNCSYGNGYRLTQNPAYRAVMLQGAESLATRFNPKVGQLRSWDHGKWNFPVIVDNLMNLEFLLWAAREGKAERYRAIAISHADGTLKNHFRADASSFHVVDYNPTNGAVIARKTHQGAADNSAWARGQAWGLYGYTMLFRETRNPAYLAQATNIANFIRNHPRLPADKVPYWDFDAPNIPDAPRDASAAAVMSSALLELSGLVAGELGQQYFSLAREQLLSLSSPAYRAAPGENGNFILMHSTGNLPSRSEVDVPLNYADYYYLEALLRYRARLNPTKVAAATVPSSRNSPALPTAKSSEVTPLSLPGSEPFVFRKVGAVELRLHVVKPVGWSKDKGMPCFVSFFGGGWNSGSPERSITWAKWAAGKGLVGIAPDYRTRDRLGGTPEDCVADARAAVRWVVEHADQLGIDPDKIICHGGSAGGHVAAWTAIPKVGPGADDPAPTKLPAALVLLNPVSDTTASGYGGPKRFGNQPERAKACSVPDQMPAHMPPTIIFHATGDTTVPYANSVAFRDKLVAQGNRCELVSFQGLGHSYNSSKFGTAGKAAGDKTRDDVASFLRSLGLMEKEGAAAAN
jgi:unsaturated chondroitin disaccharide hydrolase